jgi:HK97 family phage prohead protease
MDTKSFEFKTREVTPDGKFSGMASVYHVVDSYRDAVMPGAFTKTIAENGSVIRILSQHNPHDVIGLGRLRDERDALWVDGQLELELASAKEAYIRLKKGLINGLSIGYETVGEKSVNGVRQLTEIKLWEVSLVTFPACAPARVTNVKRRGEVDADELLSGMRSLRLEIISEREAREAAELQTKLDALRAIGRIIR